MKRSLKHSGWIPLLLSSVFIVFSFQNCSPVQFQFKDAEDLASQENPVNPALTCSFNGQTYQEGASVTAYESSSGTSCRSEVRVCRSGAFTGSFRFANCAPNTSQQNCLFNGVTVAHGQTVPAFLSSTVPAGSACSSQGRTCNNGVLSGTYQYASCSASQYAACLFNGQSIPHGQSVVAFQNASVPAGSFCSSEARICNNGTLSGSYGNASCTAQQLQAPTFSCTKTSYTCGETIRCSAQGSDINLKACDTEGCYPLLGRADWTYLGNGSFSYAKVNDNAGDQEGTYWGVLDSNGLRTQLQLHKALTCKPKFTCSSSYYACGATVSCTVSGSDGSSLMGCAPGEGCFPLNGRANWSYQGNGEFKYTWVNNNLNTSAVNITWYSQTTSGYSSTPINVGFGACR